MANEKKDLKKIMDLDLAQLVQDFESAAGTAPQEPPAVTVNQPQETAVFPEEAAQAAAAMFSELAMNPTPEDSALFSDFDAEPVPAEEDLFRSFTADSTAADLFAGLGEAPMSSAVFYETPAVEPALSDADIPAEDSAPAAFGEGMFFTPSGSPEADEAPDEPTHLFEHVGSETGESEPSEGNPLQPEGINFASNTAPEEPQEPTIRVAMPDDAPASDDNSDRNARLRDLKRKIVAGPEKRYYTLNSKGVTKLQLGMIANGIILVLCIIAIVMYTRGSIPAVRMKLIVFSQVFAMLASGLLGCSLMLDGLGDLFRLRFSMNSTLVVSFLACCADAWFCLAEERVPCCGAFVLEMGFAMMARYHRRSTEIAQMDTLRKASVLIGLTKREDYYENRTAILRGPGDVEDFIDTYARPSGPETVQQVFSVVAFVACIGIGVLAGLLHGISLAFQVFACAMLVSVPAGYFISLSRPGWLLEKRLHMVGTVVCGWQGVKKLCGKAIFPLRDKDLFPRGSTKLNGIKFYSEHVPAEVVSYTTSLISAAGGGLVPLFRNLMASRSAVEYPVTEFRDYGDGGIGGVINGESVLLGGLEFLQDKGVDIPKGTMVNQAIYVAIDGDLAAVIAITYSRMRSAAAGLVSLCGSRRLKPLLLAGDFMLTDSFISEKFSIRTRKMILPPKNIRADLSGVQPDPEADVLALVTRDDLVASVYAVTGSMALRTACRLGTLLNIVAGICGILVMLALAYLGTTELLTPANVMLYQFIWLVPGWLATEWTRTV